MICFDQYDVRKCDMSRSFENACAIDLALLHSDTDITRAWARHLLEGRTGGIQDLMWLAMDPTQVTLKRDLPA